MLGNQVKISFKRKICQFICVGLFALLIGGCGPEGTPPGVLTEKQMVNVLAEIYLAEEKAGHMGISHDSVKIIFPEFEARVFEQEGIADSVFRKSMEYYKANPKKLENIYAALVDSLSLQAQRLAPSGPPPVQ